MIIKLANEAFSVISGISTIGRMLDSWIKPRVRSWLCHTCSGTFHLKEMVRSMFGFVPCSTESIYLVFATNAINSSTQPDTWNRPYFRLSCSLETIPCRCRRSTLRSPRSSVPSGGYQGPTTPRPRDWWGSVSSHSEWEKGTVWGGGLPSRKYT